MKHFTMDAFKSYRSRLDDIHLIYEMLEEIPAKLGVKAVMPPFVLPYYNGIVPEDCGVSGFVFLEGGHFTIHTFSYRETYFVDLFYPNDFDSSKLERLVKTSFPSEFFISNTIDRGSKITRDQDLKINKELDFGPHLFIDYEDYDGISTMDELFAFFDTLPFKIGMTPIIRPYILKNKNITSILTMIAESHISLHIFHDTKRALFDIFSCKFFDYNSVGDVIKSELMGKVLNEVFFSRGVNYEIYKNKSEKQRTKSNFWFNNVYGKSLNK